MIHTGESTLAKVATFQLSGLSGRLDERKASRQTVAICDSVAMLLGGGPGNAAGPSDSAVLRSQSHKCALAPACRMLGSNSRRHEENPEWLGCVM